MGPGLARRHVLTGGQAPCALELLLRIQVLAVGTVLSSGLPKHSFVPLALGEAQDRHVTQTAPKGKG